MFSIDNLSRSNVKGERDDKKSVKFSDISESEYNNPLTLSALETPAKTL